jgi:flagellar FliL protein
MDEDQVPAKSGMGKLIIIVVVALVVLGGAGAAGWWFLLRAKPAPTAQELAAQRMKNMHYIDLEPFVTNVGSQDGNTHYLQVKIELKTFDPKVDDQVKDMTPEIRNTILRILAAQQAENVGFAQVRDQIRAQILLAVNQLLSGSPVSPVVVAAPAASSASPAAARASGAAPAASGARSVAGSIAGASAPHAASGAAHAASGALAAPRPKPLPPPVLESDGPVAGVYFTAFVVQ